MRLASFYTAIQSINKPESKKNTTKHEILICQSETGGSFRTMFHNLLKVSCD